MAKTKEAKAKQYQWNKSDNFGKIVEVVSSDDKMTFFTDGSQIFNDVIDEFLTEVIDGIIPFPGAEEVSIDGPSDSYSKSDPSTDILYAKEKKVQTVSSDELQNSAITTLIKKLSSKNIETIDTKLNINIPKKNVAKILIENSDDSREEIIKYIVSVAVEQIEINNLQEFLKEEITNFINKYYE